MAIQTNFPAIKPSLLLDFANTQTLDPRITFTRSTTATYYDGVTTAMAEQNLLTYSQEFDNAAWTKSNATITANATTAPDGTSTAEEIVPTATSAAHLVYQGGIAVSGDNVQSVFVKANGYEKVALRESEAGGYYAAFDLSGSGTVLTQSNSTASILNVGAGWFRLSMLGNRTGVTRWSLYVLDPSYTSGGVTGTWTADGTSGVYIWGAQVEQRSSVTAYTATTTQPITNYIPVLLTAPAGVARFDHSPTTGESLGLLIEEQRTNLLTYSEEFDNAAWTKSDATVTANAVVAPDGTLSGDKLVPNTNNAVHRMFIGLLGSAGAHTVSAYMKKGEYSWGVLRIEGVNSFFNLGSGTVGTVGAGNTATITDVGNGWYRCTTTRTIAGSTISTIGVASADNTDTFTGDGYSGIYIWGAQLEAGAFPTSYIATTSASVTRTADSATMTGTNFSSWYNGSAGTFYAEAYPTSVDDGGYKSVLGTYNSASGVRRSSGVTIYLSNITSRYLRGTFALANSAGNTTNVDTSGTANVKIACAWSTTEIAICGDGASAVSASLTYPVDGVADKMVIGNYFDTSYQVDRVTNGTIKKIAYYPERLTDAQLQGLTS